MIGFKYENEIMEEIIMEKIVTNCFTDFSANEMRDINGGFAVSSGVLLLIGCLVVMVSYKDCADADAESKEKKS